MGGSIGPDIRTKIATLSSEGIQRAIKSVYYQAGRSGNLCPAWICPGLPQARAVTGTLALALACFATGFVVAWLLRTGWVMTQVSWSQERMERRVRYWQGEAVYARSVAEDARQLADITGGAPVSALRPGPAAHRQRPGSNYGRECETCTSSTSSGSSCHCSRAA
jgi:hypothetical protein